MLEAAPVKAAQWASAHGVDVVELGVLIRESTPVVLIADTRVTNVGFDGRAVARQSVLQAGTAVLVGPTGAPVARCRSGTPLLEPDLIDVQTTYTGAWLWQGFTTEAIIVVEPADEPLDALVLTDPATTALSLRPTGSHGEVDADAPAPPASAVPATVAPTSTAAPITTAPPAVEPTTTDTTSAPTSEPTTEPPATGEPPSASAPMTTDVAASGSVDATSVYPGGEHAIADAIDGGRATSWFSAGDVDPCVNQLEEGVPCTAYA